MAQYIISDKRIDIFPDEAINIVDKLPLGNYRLRFIPETGQYFLEKLNLTMETTKPYGNHVANRERIINTFNKRQKNMGILLSGLKGTGKTFLVRDISLELKKQGISSIIIDSSFDTPSMAKFLSRITESVFVIFDEFDKNFASTFNDNSIIDNDDIDRDNVTSKQNGLLTLLDGMFSNKMLFAFCCNNDKKINEYFIHRPSRIYYHIKFNELNTDTIRQYCNDNLINKSYIKDITILQTAINDFSFDILKAIVEECNAYNESPLSAINYLNINVEKDCYYNVRIIDMVRNEEIPYIHGYNSSIHFNPLHLLDGSENQTIYLDSRVLEIEDEYFCEIYNRLTQYEDYKITEKNLYDVDGNKRHLCKTVKISNIESITNNGEIISVNEDAKLKAIFTRNVASSVIDTSKIAAIAKTEEML